MDTRVKQPEKAVQSIPEANVPERVSPSILRVLKTLIIAFLVIGSCVVILLQTMDWMRGSPLFTLKKIKVEGNYSLSRHEVVAILSIPSNPHLFNLPVENLRAHALAHPWIGGVSIEREYPSTLKIEIEERQPAAMVLGDSLVYIDGEGYLLPQPQNIRVFDVPCIVNIKDFGGRPGEKTENEELLAAVELLEELRMIDTGFWNNISELDWEKGEAFVIQLYDFGIPIRIPKKGRMKDRLYVLNYFLNFLHDEEKLNDIALIDLSYSGQLIVKTKKNKQVKK